MIVAIVRLTARGTARVLDGVPGTIFPVDSFGGIDDRCAMVRDYRYPQTDHNGKLYQIWTLGEDDYELIERFNVREEYYLASDGGACSALGIFSMVENACEAASKAVGGGYYSNVAVMRCTSITEIETVETHERAGAA